MVRGVWCRQVWGAAPSAACPGPPVPRGEVLQSLPLRAEWDGAIPGALSWEKNDTEHLIPIFLQNFLPPVLLVSSFPSCFRWRKGIACLAQSQKCSWLSSLSYNFFLLSFSGNEEERPGFSWDWAQPFPPHLCTSSSLYRCGLGMALPSPSPWKGPCCPLCLEGVNTLKQTKKWTGVVWISGAN